MKKIIILLFSILSVFLIFIFSKDDKINYLSIGDTLIRGINSYDIVGYGYNDYVKNYLKRNDLLRAFNTSYYNNSIIGFEDDIKNNKTLLINDSEFYLKKLLRESDLLVISLGMDELAYYFSNNYENLRRNFDKMLVNLEDFINTVVQYAKNDIIFIGYYNPSKIYTSDIDEMFYYIDNKLITMLDEYDVHYISIYEKVKGGNYLDNDNNYHLNTKGYLMIANEIIAYIEKMN